MVDIAPHVPVLLREAIEGIAPQNNGIYIDGTFGRGGYSRSLLLAAETTVFGIDRDPAAVAVGQKMVDEFAPRFKILHGTFGNMVQLLSQENVASVDGIALDLGVSSPQLDEAERGFSFQADGPLDMRMSLTGTSAADLVNTQTERELADIIFQNGDERYARRVARLIVEERAKAPITRTKQLADLVRKVVPRSGDGIDPATRTFQALRVVVNDELGELKRALEAAIVLLKPQGRLAVVSFHSLEDRCVKEFLRQNSAQASRGSRHVPANDEGQPALFNILTKKPQTATEADIKANPRARSGKLRLAERTDAHKEYVA